MKISTLLKNGLVNGNPANILIENMQIAAISSKDMPAEHVYDVSGYHILPGMIDLHTHIRDMGLVNKEDWVTASTAALQGGVTTVFDMPNTIPPTTNLENYLYKLEFAKKSSVNYGCYLGCSSENFNEVSTALSVEPSIPGLKIFMAGSSQNEIVEDPAQLREFFLLARKHNKPVLLHCETHGEIEENKKNYSGEEFNDARYHSTIRHRSAAVSAVTLATELAEETGASIHILHVGTKEEIDIIAEYKAKGFTNITCETTPHHLLLNEEHLERFGNFAKVNPPIRTQGDNLVLINAVKTGIIDTIGSDHAPHTLQEKVLPYFNAPSGFPGLETTLLLLYHHLVVPGIIKLEQLTKLISTNPAEILNIKRRGKLEVGYFADIVVLNPNAQTEINPTEFATKAKYSPYQGMRVHAAIMHTFVNGICNNQKGMVIEYDQS